MVTEMTDEQVREMLAKEAEIVGGQTAWAELHDVHPSRVSRVLKGRDEPGGKILSALGLERVNRYRPVAA